MKYYIKIHNSPRSKIFPNEYNLKLIDFVFNLPLIKTVGILPYKFINERKKLIPTKSEIYIEYDGNIFLNFWIISFSLINKNKLVLDCHNSSLENQKGHFFRYFLNIFYLLILNRILNVKVLVHNNKIKPLFIRYEILETPYPKFNFSNVLEKTIDVLFLCSLNSDEPIDEILKICSFFKRHNLKAKITGNYNKVKDLYSSEFFIIPYLSYDQYIKHIRQSNITVSLTKRDKTLLFAPRESIALNVDCFVNNSQVNREFYGNKVNYIDIKHFEVTCKELLKKCLN